MSKLVNFIKYVLLIVVTIFCIIFFCCYGRFSSVYESNVPSILNIFYEFPKSSFLLILIIGTLVFLGILDIRKKYNNKVYNLLFILIELLLIFVFIRTLFEPNFNQFRNVEDYYYDILNITYLFQNNIYFIIMLVPLILYRKINK